MNSEQSYVGQTIGRYRFTELIGSGAVGEVYKAFDERLLRPVAIKVSSPRAGDDDLHLVRIIREAQIIARVEHANIVPIYDIIDHGLSALIVMRLIKGKDLGQLLRHFGRPLDAGEAYKIMYPVMLGMDFAHGKGVVHSDLKPGNIFISNSEEVFILDFGLSALLELERMGQGKIYGTPLYMPPEQFGGSYLDARSDIYSLGLILYSLVTGSHPFEHEKSLSRLLKSQVNKTPEAPARKNPAIPEAFSDCVMRALEKNPRLRYYSCRDFLYDMEQSIPGVVAEQEKSREARWDPRIDVHIEANLHLEGVTESMLTKISNLSVSGASIFISATPRIGSKLSLVFDISEDDIQVNIAARATVMWVDSIAENNRTEIGVSFDDLDGMKKQTLGRYIRNLLLA